MLSAIDVPKSKSISIAFIALKSCLFGLFLTLSYTQIQSSSTDTSATYQSNACSDSMDQLAIIMKLFFILGLLLDLFLLAFFLISSKFRKMQYFILFGFHVIFMGFMLVLGLVQAIRGNGECSLGKTMIGTAVILTICLIVSSIFIMWCNLYFSLKYAHLGCNIVWTFMYLQIQNYQKYNIFVSVIGWIHGILSVLGLVFFVVMAFLRKNSRTAKCWKQFYIISLVLMLLSYILCFIASAITPSQLYSTQLFIHTYQKFGLFQMLGAILLLIFMNTQMGDPRDGIMRNDVKVFNRGGKESQGFKITDDVN